MTVGTGTPYNVYTGNGVSTIYAYGFTVLSSDDMLVTIDGVTTTAYTLTGIGDEEGGNVIFTSAPANLSEVVIRRSVALQRDTDYQTNGDLLAAVVNDDFDRLMMIAQELSDGLTRTIRIPELATELPELPAAAVRASKVLGFDADGDPVALVGVDSASATALDLALRSIVSEDAGSGQIGVEPSLPYDVSTAGHWMTRVLPDFHVFRWITPSEWPAILDGTSTYDASSAWASAITAAIASGRPARVTGATGRYYFSGVIGTFTGNDITLDFAGSTLDFAGVSLASTSSILIFTGTYGSTKLLTSNAAANQKTVACDSSIFAVGDMVRIYSDDLWDSTRTSTRIGELNFVETVPGGTSVTTTMELQSTYATADSATIQKLTPVKNIVIRNGKIIGPSGNDELRGLRFVCASNCHFENISSFDVDYFHMQITDGINCSVRGCYFEESNSSSTGYGVSFADASCDCLAYGNHFVNVRHSLSTNNNVSTSYGVTDRIRFENNSIRDSAKATGGTGGDAIDTHAGARNIFVVNNTVHSSSGAGINFEAQGGAIIGNVVKSTASVGIYYHPYADAAGTITINDNKVDQIGDGSGTDPGIYVLGGAIAPERVTINGNHIDSATSEAIRVAGLAGGDIGYLTMTGNTARSAAGSSAIRANYVTRGVISGNTAICDAGPYGIYIEDCDRLAITGNSVNVAGTGTTSRAVYLLGTGTRLSVVGNVIEHSGSYATIEGVFLGNSITNTAVHCNTFPGITTDVTLGAGAGNVQTNNA